MKSLEEGDVLFAAKRFNQAEILFPQSEWAPKSSLMASYAYYVQDAPFASDNCFDETAKFILDNWDEIEHRHKSYLTKDALKAGTFLGKYPSIVEGAVDSFKGVDKL